MKLYYEKKATSEERAELMALLGDESRDEQTRGLIMEIIKSQQEPDEKLDVMRAEDILKRIFEIEAPEDEGTGFVDITGEEVVEESDEERTIWRNIGYWAAAAAIFAVSLGTYLTGGGRSVMEMLGQNKASEEVDRIELLPGGDKAILTLWDGTVIHLESAEQRYPDADFKIDAEKGELTYNGLETQVGYNLLTTPLGGQYKVVLPDGSGAWLNAGSSLRFPTSFVGENRKVEVSGEVFFDVRHENDKPFIVTLRHPGMKKEPVEIVVLGTQFNVSSYSDDPAIQTTLLEGSVQVKKGVETKILLPGEQAEVAGTEGVESKIEVKSVDAESVAAWKAGMFEFNGGSIEGIMRQIARWYDVEVEYKGDVRSKRFYGAISRKESAAEVLKFLELTGGVGFEINGNKIKVKAM